jgi:transcriptional regulator GlxA family with amidase domain
MQTPLDMPMTKRDQQRRPGRKDHTRDHESVVSRVEEFVRSSIHQMSLPEICQALGVSRRTVERAFQEQHDTSPHRYFRMLRMISARKDLVEGGGTVKRIAAKHGFYEAARFAGRYKQMFGEYPSETLARSKQKTRARRVRES